MAKKPFEIQSADLIIGGINLQAGSTGVVIPGITQATEYRVEEVEDAGDQTYQFTPNSEVVVIDAALYNAIVAALNESGFADFTATTDDEGYIDEIQVNGRGTYSSGNASYAENFDMSAYVGAGSASDRPIVPEDWIQIPFRPRMRAGSVETIGGGGGGGSVELREIVFPQGESGDTQGTIALNEAGNTYICIADWTNSTYEGDADIETSIAYNIGQSGGVLLSWTTNVEDYPDIRAVLIADGWNGSSTDYGFSNPSGFQV